MAKNTITLGTWSWGSGMVGGDQIFGNHTDAAQLKPVFDAAMREGLTRWDTAAVYGMGASEEILGSFVRGVERERIELSTKFTPQIAESYDNSMEKMIEDSLKRLCTDYIDIYWIHNPMDVERWTPQLIPLLRSGKIKRVGVSNHNIDEIKRTNAMLNNEGFSVSAVQNHFSLLYRSSERGGVIDYCRDHNIEFWAYMVLEQGVLSGKYNMQHPLPSASARGQKYNPILKKLEKLTDALAKIGENYDITPSQTAMAWAIAKGTMPIIGATKENHVVEAAKAQNIKLNKNEIEELERLADETGVDTRGDWEHEMD